MKKVKKTDPFAEREAAKYENPIVSREVILDYLTQAKCAKSRQDIALAFELAEPNDQEALRRRLRAMERDGQIMCDRKGNYAPLGKVETLTGVVCTRRGGAAWVLTKTGTEVQLDSKDLHQVFPGDEVNVRILGYDHHKHSLSGKIESVLIRHTHQMVGRYHSEGQEVAYVSPENTSIPHDVLLLKEHLSEGLAPNENDFVVVQITTQPTKHTPPIGRIVEVLGNEHSANSLIEMAVRAHHLPHFWPEDLESELDGLPEFVEAKDLNGREDWRSLSFITIDGEDAKDFDDAVYCEKGKRGEWILYVAIADVSYYVRTGTALDREAERRGNSVYFPNRVIPMLPEPLSNGLCSLKPKVDRLTLGCKMRIGKQGDVLEYQFFKSLIHSKARLTYTKVAAMLENPDAIERKEYASIVPMIENLKELFEILLAARTLRGALDFDTVESRMILGANGKIEQIIPVKRNVAHRIIEECMLCANVSAAKFLLAHNVDGVFRIHEPPKAEKLEDLRSFLKLRGLFLKGGATPSPKDFSHLLTEIQGREDHAVLQTVILRSMNQAVYSPENVGHYGLAYEAYTHFTSPIRRYPDLVVHRVIRLILDKGDASAVHYVQTRLSEMSVNLSHTERRADDATRDVEGALKCTFMEAHIGEVFEGLITGVTHFGFFVMLDGFYIDGLVHVTSLKQDYYHFDEAQHALIGERSRKVYKLGDRLKVKVTQVKVEERKIDFECVK